MVTTVDDPAAPPGQHAQHEDPVHAPADLGEVTRVARALVGNVERVVRGRHEAVELVTVALLAGGHVVVEDVPGTGKTTLARAVARSVGGSFHRVQATADLLPADITGSSVWDPAAQRFTFVAGPVFAHVVLVDELNRTPPRTQSAFLEVMDEGAVTVDGVRHPVPDPFFVVATQNPLEQHGTYPLPEGQLDRFAVRLRLGGLDADSELLVVREQLAGPTVDQLAPVVDADRLRAVRAAVRTLHVADPVLAHALALVRRTREDPRVRLGASSRAAITLVRCAQARAALAARDYVTPDDVRALAVPVLAHRLSLPASSPGGTAAEALVAEIAGSVPVPVQV
ncbi:MoxR family ATPase [Kineosporia sp. R_H_3]|uniref:AAA family ATPase n=1 Tax=Kineosporia sp. R_H_3 TaxID=1961848 RepID=UPI000B4B6427|nr:MoxR family ATPase [Kineosporia sp. R_H_3]